MRNPVFWGGLCVCLTRGAAAALAAAALVAPPASPSEMNWTRKSVMFSHQTHIDALAAGDTPACVACHHPVGGETPFQTCAAPACHDNLNAKDHSSRSYYLATHKKKKAVFHSCLSCHEERAGADTAKMKRLAGCEESACHP